MRIDDFKKKENPVIKLLNKYFGLKYSIIFLALKELPKSKPTATGLVSMFLIGYTLYFMTRHSRWFWWSILLWVICYGVQIIIKIYKSKQNKNGGTRKENN